jgi:hypothetical protein
MGFHIIFGENQILKKLDTILKILGSIQRKEEAMSQELDALAAQVAANAEVEQSAILLIQGIAAQLEDLSDDPAQVLALAETLKASAANLAAAISANTPPVPVPE